jgi:beta-hydroxylase
MARHEVENATDERRVVLLLHIKRPVARWAAPLRDGGLWLIRKSPFVQDAKRRIDAWAA